MNTSQSNFTINESQYEDYHNTSNAKIKKIATKIDYEFIKNSLQDVKMNVKDCGNKSTIG